MHGGGDETNSVAWPTPAQVPNETIEELNDQNTLQSELAHLMMDQKKLALIMLPKQVKIKFQKFIGRYNTRSKLSGLLNLQKHRETESKPKNQTKKS